MRRDRWTYLVLIDKLDELVATAKNVPMTDQVRIDREELFEIIDQMRSTIPEEIKQARWIVKERQEMLAEAKREAERLIGEARDQAQREASQQEVVKLAERQAHELLERGPRQGARDAARRRGLRRRILENLEVNLGKFLAAVQRGREQLASRDDEGTGPGTAGFDTSGVAADQMIDLRSMRLGPGDVRHERPRVAVAPLTIAGQEYTRDAGRAGAAARPAGRLRRAVPEAGLLGARQGPCFRCLEPAQIDLDVRSSEYHSTDPNESDPELALRLHRRRPAGRRALGARRAGVRAAGQDPLTAPDCPGLCPHCGVRLEPDVRPRLRRGPELDTRWAKLRDLL